MKYIMVLWIRVFSFVQEAMKNEGVKVTKSKVLAGPADGFYSLEPLIQGKGVE